MLYIRCGKVALICFFFFNDTATTEIYTLSLHDALPISEQQNSLMTWEPAITTAIFLIVVETSLCRQQGPIRCASRPIREGDRKSTRLNSSHSQISYAVFCLKKKKKAIYTCIASRH